MIDFPLKYQAVIFSSVEEITPSPDNLTYFINKFKDKELIPSTFQELSTSGLKNRFNLKSSDNIWNIEFGGSRIDIIKTNNDLGKVEMGSLSLFINDVKNIINIIFDKFPHNANRVAFVTNYLLKAMEKDELNKIFTNISNPIETYQINPPITWNQRFVTRLKKSFSDKTELLNVISDINRVNVNLKINSKIELFDRIELKFDINTYQGNSEYRFMKDDMIGFYESILDLEKSIKEEYIQIF